MAKDSDFDVAGNSSNLQAADGVAHDNPSRGGEALTSDLHDSRGSGSAEGEDAADAPDRVEGTAAERGQVGPGRPPRDTRWKKGGPSPNPRGRPRKDQTMRPDLKKWFEQAIDKKISVPRGERKVLMNRIEIGLEQLLNQFAKGDRHARRDLMDYAERLGVDLLARGGQAIEQALTPDYQAILDAYRARLLGTTPVKPAGVAPAPPESVSAPPKPALVRCRPAVEHPEPIATSSDPVVALSAPTTQERVFAPPELLDDDVVEDSSTAQEATLRPTVDATPEVRLPTPMPGKDYPKPPAVPRLLGTTAAKPAGVAPAPPESVSAPRKPVLVQRKLVAGPLEPVAAPSSPVVVPSTPTAQERVFAPPELLDDDAVAESPAAREATVPVAAEVTPEIQLPTPAPGMKYHKRIDLMTASELRAWFPEWYARYGEAWSKQKLEKERRASLWLRR